MTIGKYWSCVVLATAGYCDFEYKNNTGIDFKNMKKKMKKITDVGKKKSWSAVASPPLPSSSRGVTYLASMGMVSSKLTLASALTGPATVASSI
jgi:hypothetical protein